MSLAIWHHRMTACYLPPNTSKHTPQQPQPDKRVLYLPTQEGWKAELTYVIGYIPRRFNHPQMVTHRSTNPAAYGWESNSLDHKPNA